MPNQKAEKKTENAKLIGITIVVTTFLLLGAAYFLDQHLKSNIFSSVFSGDKVPRHFVKVEMISTSGDISYTFDLKVGFFKKRNAKHCRKTIPRIKNDILMLELGEDIKARNMDEIKEKISATICKHCPEAEGNITFEKFWHQ